jgi:hypothetical protein
MGFWDTIDEFLRHAGNTRTPLSPGIRVGRGALGVARAFTSPQIDTFDRSSGVKSPSMGQRAIRPVGAGTGTRSGFGTAPGYQEQNPLGGLYEQLLGMLTSGSGVNEADLMAQIRGQFDPVYDARRQAIEGMMSQAEGRTDRNRADVESLYGDLAEDYERLAPEAKAQAEQAQAEVEQLYGELRSNIEGTYSRISDEQSDQFKQLGIEEVAPSVLNPQAEQAAAASADASELQAINAQRYMDIGNMDQRYYREGSPLATLTGANRSSDLLVQLQDYLAGREGDITQLEAERTAGIQSAYTQLAQQAQSQAFQQQGQQAGMLWDILQSQLQGQQEPTEMTADTFLTTLPPQMQQEVGSIFRQLERRPEVIQNRQEQKGHPVPGTYVNITPEWWLNEVDRMYEQGQISDSTRQALMMYLRLRNSG